MRYNIALILPQSTIDKNKIYLKYLKNISIEASPKVEQFYGLNRKPNYTVNTVYLLQPDVIEDII